MANQVRQAIAVHVLRVTESQTGFISTATEGERSLVYPRHRIECATRQDGHRDVSFAAWVDAVGRIAWLDVYGDRDERKAGAGQTDHLRAAGRVVGDGESPNPRPSGRRCEGYTNGAVRAHGETANSGVGLGEIATRDNARNIEGHAAGITQKRSLRATSRPDSLVRERKLVWEQG